MLSIKGVTAAYGETVILRDVDIDIPEGAVVALMGRNGVGKTTLLKTVMGLIHPLSGTITYNESDIVRWKPETRALQGIGYVPQGREVFP
jgi:urea transport system ATP-binding protein